MTDEIQQSAVEVDRSDAADAKRFRWILAGNGYYMEENFLCPHYACREEDQDSARREIDEQINMERT